ncbi:MAG: hypothetical protein M3Y87_08080 [Myxococcota bacterium]|nr:hypothetical protein [Myxococcota bacterium]
MNHALALPLALASILAPAPLASAQAAPELPRARATSLSLAMPAPAPAVLETALLAADEDAQTARSLGIRRTMADWMTGLGVAAVLSMTTANVFGAISFSDRYGFRGSYEETPCAQGNAVLPEYCEGTVWPQAIAGGLTTTLYVTASMLGMFMPDPLHVGDSPGPLGERIRVHRILRIFTSTLVIAQALLGLAINHADEWFGLDRRQDFGAMQALSATHLGLGLAAITSLAAQGAVMVF